MSDPNISPPEEPPPTQSSRKRVVVVVLVALLLAIGLRLVGSVVDRDPTGRAVGTEQGCGDRAAAPPPSGPVDTADAEAVEAYRAMTIARQDLARQLREAFRDPSLWVLPAPPEDGDWSEFPQVEANPLTDAKIRLGKQLFFEPGLAAANGEFDYSHSCATCHDPRISFASGTSIGRGLGAGAEGLHADRRVIEGVPIADVDVTLFGERRIVNVAWTAEVASWMGDFDTQKDLSPNAEALAEGMGGTEMFVESALQSHRFYAAGSDMPAEGSVLREGVYDELLAEAWPELSSDERVQQRVVAMAIASYIRSITTFDAPFQQFLRLDPDDETAELPLTDAAMRGGIVFFGEGRCTACHSGPALASPRFEAIGTRLYEPDTELPGWTPPDAEGENGWGTLAQLYRDRADNRGHFRSSGDPDDIGRYMVPSVYGGGNVGLQRWGHGGAHDNLADFIAHKVGGNDPELNTTLDETLLEFLSPLLFSDAEPFLDDAQIDDLVAFIEQGLEDTGLAERHMPSSPVSLGGYCSPNNDALSRTMTPGCDEVRLPADEGG